ncbi:MAG: hypothetical protein IJP92_13755 [Lachnospiraceae bacterium]|nr:hypothetical protein [Lachnospiraceae bacterium]
MKKERKTGIRLLTMLLIAALTAGSGMLSAPFALEAKAATNPPEFFCTGEGGHQYYYTTDHHEATCTEPGTEDWACGAHNQSKTIIVRAALGHSYKEYERIDPTCTAEGHVYYRCSVCQEDKSEPIPATGHAWDGGKVTKEASCTEKGSRSFSCTRCGEQRTEDIAAKGHTPVVVAGKAATCTEKGLTDGQNCSVCGAVLQEQTEIAALDHDWDAGKEREVQGTGARLLAGKEIVYTCRRDASHTKTEKAGVSATDVMARFRNKPLNGKKPAVTPLVITQQPVGGSMQWNSDYELRVKVSGGVEPYRYTWYMVNDGSKKDPGRNLSRAKAALAARKSDIWKRVGNTPVIEAENPLDTPLFGTNSPVCHVSRGDREYYCVIMDAAGQIVTSDKVKVDAPKLAEDELKDLYVKTLTEDVVLSPGESTELRFEVGGGNTELGRKITVYTQRVSDFKPFVYDGTVPEPQVMDSEDPFPPVIQSLNITASIPNEMRGYFVVVSDKLGRTVQSDMIVVTCRLKIKTQPVGGVIGEGETHTLSIEVEGGKEPYTYRLYPTDSRAYETPGFEPETQTGGPSASFTVDKTGRYYIHVQDADGLFAHSDYVTVESAVFRIRDYSPQQGEFSFPDGSTKTGFRVEAEGGEAPYTFHWEKVYATDGRSWYGRDERTAFQYTSAAQEDPVGYLEMHTPGLYSCTVTDATGASATVEEMEYRYAGDAPYITIQPRMMKIRTGRSGTEKYTLYCDAVGSKGDDSTLYFRWFKFDSETMAWVVYAGSGKYYTPSKTDSPNTVYYCSVWDEATDQYTSSIECGFYIPMQFTTAAQRGTGDSIDVVVTGGAAPYQVEAVRVVRDPLPQVQTGSTGKPIEFNAMRFLQKYELLPEGGCGFTLAGIDRYRTNKESGQKEAYTYIIRVKDATGATVTQEVTCKW